MLKLLDDGSFELEVDGKRTKGLIRAVATADDIIKATSLGYSALEEGKDPYCKTGDCS